jgi:hypothetical protein
MNMKSNLKVSALATMMLAATTILSTVTTNVPAVAQPATTTAPTSAAVSEATIRSLQEALNKQGIAVKADGILTDETRAAIRKYQSQHHLPVTGEPDKATLDKLGVSVASGAGPAGQTAQAPPTAGMMGPQMMPQGMMGPSMMGSGMMGPGMMGSGAMEPGMMGPGMGGQARGTVGLGVVTPSRNVSVEDVRHHLDRLLQSQGNARVKLGEIKEADKDTIVADIVTTEGSLVDRFNVNRRSGVIQRVQ